MSMEWKVDEWCIYELKIVQIKKLEPYAEYSDGCICGSGRGLDEYFRPLTLRSKSIIESLDFYYDELRKMDGSNGFNFPDIHRYFSDLSRQAIDGDDDAAKVVFKSAQDFVRAASDYQKVIDGIALFRPR